MSFRDIISLRQFCEGIVKKNKDAEKKEMLRAIINKPIATKKGKNAKYKKQNSKRKINLGWLHFDSNKSEFVTVPSSKGGGIREVALPLITNKDAIIEAGKSLFFPRGDSTFGPEYEMEFGVANFQHQDLTTLDVDGLRLPFTLQRYIEQTKFARIRIYLTSKLKLQRKASDTANEASSFDEDANEADRAFRDELDQAIECALTQLENGSDIVMSTSSLPQQDLNKTQTTALASCEYRNLERLRSSREARIPPTPDSNEIGIEIQVLHCSVGQITRSFRLLDKVLAIYDWVGSFTCNPGNFVLIDSNGNLAEPSSSVVTVKGALSMQPSDMTPPMDDSISFYGFGQQSSTVVTNSKTTLLPSPDEIPDQNTCQQKEELAASSERSAANYKSFLSYLASRSQ